MKARLPLLSALALSMGLAILPAAQAALPFGAGTEINSLAPVVEKVSPGVVNISVSGSKVSRQVLPEPFRFFFGPNMPGEQVRERPFQALGSGVIIDADKGYVITNNHVIEDADKILITLIDGQEYEAELIGSDKESDIALLKVDAKNLVEIGFADSDKLRVGDFAIAIGNPFGLGQTVTTGVISALGRTGLNVENLENFIQTDAAINSGNSGGALLDLEGNLVGINTAILGPGGGNIGIGFAIPANMVKNLADQILEYGEVRRGVLGVMGGELTSELARTFGYRSQHGAFVSQVLEDSAAAEAGLKAGDIIISLDGKPIRSFGELRAKVATMGADRTVELGLFRDGKEKTLEVTLDHASEQKVAANTLHQALEGASLTNSEHGDGVRGVKVTEVTPRSPAALAGLEEGDLIIGVNRQRVKELGELRRIIEAKPEVLALNIQRGNSSIYLVLR
ncbi:Do family serine endopeptidase [Oceanimonas sp. CHS3-5]|uniref:Do family serine endopeptidase n=1 Tax=Oceanimonas sp. CHS3-5 TaxID=3068186 RepID=UPI00273DAE3C|nr:Do family serine endopeptidase [Oceanimonas sp. CHS3-5]MDP5293138.1 Do family serine endopeptidase [Oceanimonas sp. CHS3-5]